MGEHDCMDFRARVVLNEGDDVFVERCSRCGKIRMERGGSGRPMAWFRAPSVIDPTFPWRYAYPSPQAGKYDSPEIWIDP